MKYLAGFSPEEMQSKLTQKSLDKGGLTQEVEPIVEMLKGMGFEGKFFTEIRKGNCDNPVIEFEKNEKNQKTSVTISRFMNGFFMVIADYVDAKNVKMMQGRFLFGEDVVEYLYQYQVRQAVLQVQNNHISNDVF